MKRQVRDFSVLQVTVGKLSLRKVAGLELKMRWITHRERRIHHRTCKGLGPRM